MGRSTVFREQNAIWSFLLPIVDVFTTIVFGFAAWLILQSLELPGYPDEMPQHFTYAIAVAAIFTPTCFSWTGMYRPWRGQDIFRELRSLLAAWALVFFLLAALALLTRTGGAFSRLWLGTWFTISLLGFGVGRVMLRYMLRASRRLGYDQKRIVVVGSGELAQSVIRHLKDHPWAGFRVLGVFETSSTVRGDLLGVPILGTVDELFGFLDDSDNAVKQVWLALPLSEERSMAQLLVRLRATGVDVCFVPDIFGMRMLQNEMLNIAGLPVLNLTGSPLYGLNRLIKDLEDKVLAFGIMILTLPVMLTLAMAIKLTSPGPVLYRQIRHGWDGKKIEVYKFRTMYVQDASAGFQQATRDDKRVTPIGKFLRRTSLDELPQFINVLQGRMSVIGPRPHAVEHNALFEGQVDRYKLRHKVKPGITGWAQVNGFRGETDTLYKMQKRVEYDLFYIEHWSFMLDIKILFLTLLKGFSHKNAY